MPNINSLTYNGMKSTDLGVYVTGSGSFDAAEMDADKYEIAGRNGDLIIPKNRYKNIVVTYPAFIPKAFQGKAQSIRNWMRSAKAYARLEDTYDMEHYRLGLASGIQSFEPVNRNDASNFQLNFDCRPERFLKTGETPLPIEPEAHSYSGEIVSFETVAVDDMTKAEVSLSPIQSGSGDPSPTNVRPISGHTGAELNVTGKNIALPYAFEQGSLSGSGSHTNSTIRVHSGYIEVEPSKKYAIEITGGAQIYEVHEYVMALGNNTKYTTVNATETAITMASTTHYIRVLARYSNNGTITPSDISGFQVCEGDATDLTTLTLSFGQTVYGCTFDFVSGKLKITWVSVLGSLIGWSYNATYKIGYGYLNGKKPGRTNIISSAYNTVDKPYGIMVNGEVSGSLSDTGFNVKDDSTSSLAEFQSAVANVQFAYELATPIEIDLDPIEVQTLFGLNNVWASDGTVEINYADPFNVDNPTYFEARPLFEITNPAQNDVLNVNGKTITFLSSYTGTVTIDCETMDCFSGYTNLNYLISATDFLVLNEGVNIVTWSGSGTCKMTPRWWEL